MSLSRRQTLALIGGGVIVAAGVAGAGFLATRTPARALAPWAAGAAYTDPRMRALSFAILAPNPHNLQPWLIDLTKEGAVTILRDPARALPHTDPFDRQIVIGFGAFLEQLAIAAAADGWATDVQLFPEGETEGRPIAVVRFRPGGAPDPLAEHILARRSLKAPFDLARPVAEADLARLAAAASGLTAAGATAEPDRVAALRTLTLAALLTESQSPEQHRESVELMRFGRAEIEANPDGIDLGGPFLEALMLAGLVSREGMLDPTSQGARAGVAMYSEMMAATPAYVWLATAGNARADQIAAGRAWLRINLTATALGLGLHPVSQALQEFPAMAEHYAAAHALLGKPGETVQMLGRVGYGPATPPSPRWPLETRIVRA